MLLGNHAPGRRMASRRKNSALMAASTALSAGQSVMGSTVKLGKESCPPLFTATTGSEKVVVICSAAGGCAGARRRRFGCGP